MRISSGFKIIPLLLNFFRHAEFIDQFAFHIALKITELYIWIFFDQLFVEILESLIAIYLWLPCTKQI